MSDTSGKGPEKPEAAGTNAEQANPGTARPRPPVIDLEAKDVGKTEAATKPAATSPVGGSVPPSSTMKTPTPPKPQETSKTPPPPPPPHKPKEDTAEAGYPMMPLVAAAIGGAALATAVVFGLSAAGLIPSGQDSRVAALESDVVRLQDAISTARDGQRPDPRVAELSRQLSELSEKVEATATAPASGAAADTTELASRLQQIEQGNAALSTRVEELAREAGSANASLGQRVEELGRSSQSVQQAASADDRSALALSAAAALDAALMRGGSYADEMTAVQAFMPSADVGPLAAHAEAGIPSATTIATAWRKAVDVAPPPPPAADAGVVDRFMANARSLVRVTPTGEPSGDAPEARRARFEAALNRVDLSKALEEWEGLAASVKEASAEQAKAARTRLDAEAASAALRTAALNEARKAVTAP
jgi:hypothetical protein